MAAENEGHPGGSDAANLIERHRLEQPTGDGFDTISSSFQNPYSGEALPAFMSVPHYPDATNNRTSIPVSEIVNAVIEPGDFFRHQTTSSGLEIPGTHTSPPMELYMSDSEMTDALSEVGGVPLDDYQMNQMGSTGFVNQFAYDAGSLRDYIGASEGTDEDSETDLDMEPQPPYTSQREPISFATLEDEDDTRKFYLDGGDGSDYDADSHHTSDDDGRSHVSEVDLDDFYRPPDYTYVSQESGVDPSSSYEEHANSFSDLEDVNGDPAADPHFVDSVIHGTSMYSSYLSCLVANFLLQHMRETLISLSLYHNGFTTHLPLPYQCWGLHRQSCLRIHYPASSGGRHRRKSLDPVAILGTFMIFNRSPGGTSYESSAPMLVICATSGIHRTIISSTLDSDQEPDSQRRSSTFKEKPCTQGIRRQSSTSSCAT